MRLTVWQCQACGTVRLCGRHLCPECSSGRWLEAELPSVGRLLAVTRVHIASAEVPVAGLPFTLCLVKTDVGGVQFMAASEEDLTIGDAVALSSDRQAAPYLVTRQPASP